MKTPEKERDLAGTAAFEVALQHIMIRQDRSYHFIQLLTAISSLIFTLEVCLIFFFTVLIPLLAIKPQGYFGILQEYVSPPLAFVSAICLILLRAGNQWYAIEPGELLTERLNTNIMEPCLGMHFDYRTGKMISDDIWVPNTDITAPVDDTSQA